MTQYFSFLFFCNLLENWNNNDRIFIFFFFVISFCKFGRIFADCCSHYRTFSLSFFFFFEEVKEGCSMEKIISRFRLVLGESSVLF